METKEEIFALFGFYLGDGTKKNNRTIAITNSNPDVIQTMIRIFELFGITRDKLKASITIKSPVKSDTKEYWAKITQIPLKSFQKTNWRNGKSKITNGSVKIEYYSAEIKRKFDQDFEKIKAEALKEKTNGIAFLRGLAAADGSFARRKNKVHKIMFCVFGEERVYTKRLLKSLKINFFEEGEAISVAKKKDMLNLLKQDIFKYHPERNSEFLQLGEALHTPIVNVLCS